MFRYFRGAYVPAHKPWATVYVHRPRSRRSALENAWKYARKGADAV